MVASMLLVPNRAGAFVEAVCKVEEEALLLSGRRARVLLEWARGGQAPFVKVSFTLHPRSRAALTPPPPSMGVRVGRSAGVRS